MGPKKSWLSWLVAVALTATGALVLSSMSASSRSSGCAAGWPAGATMTGSLGRGSGPAVRVSHSRWGWRLDLRTDGRQSVTGVVSADARVLSLRATRTVGRALHRGARGFSFQLTAAAARQQVRFTLACAHRMSFGFTGLRVVLGARAAPAASFVLSRPPQTGVAGQLIAGPTCPVVTPSCPRAPGVQGTVRVETAPATRDSGPGTFVKSVATDAQGQFSTDLPPGAYVLSARSSAPSPGASGESSSRAVQVDVQAGVVSQVILAFDTGIR